MNVYLAIRDSGKLLGSRRRGARHGELIGSPMPTGGVMPRDQEPDGKYVKAKDLKLHYHDFGTGYPVICIHGAGPGASGWSNFKGNIEAFEKQYRMMLFDMPQFGKSDKPVIKDQRLTFVADVLDAFMAATGIEKAHFIGNSMGGQAALKLAVDHPNRVDKVVVIGSGVI